MTATQTNVTTTTDPPRRITLWFCGQPGCAHEVRLEARVALVNAGLAAATDSLAYRCPFHGAAVGQIRRADYVRSDVAYPIEHDLPGANPS